MGRPQTVETDILDRLDRQLIHALQADPRAPFSHIADVLGVSEQTVARRYRRLRGDGIVRVIGVVDPQRIGQADWLVRVGCRPGAAGRLADALARRDDVSWVMLTSGGSEVVCLIRARSQQQRDELMLQRLPATSQVLSMTAHAILHRFVAGNAADWSAFGDPLTAAQSAALRPVPVPPPAEPVVLQPDDEPILAALARDGRSSYAALAAATGWTEGRVTRRVDALLGAGVLYFDVDLASQLMGYTTIAELWLTVEPSRLATVGEQLARHEEVPFVAAITGSANLVANVLCRDSEALYEYVTTKIGAVDGVRHLETSPMLRRVKQAGTLMDGLRLAALPPGAPAGPGAVPPRRERLSPAVR
jgi:DNA-binding Lrp family transcriptional regulator